MHQHNAVNECIIITAIVESGGNLGERARSLEPEKELPEMSSQAMQVDEKEKKEEEDFRTGPLSVLAASVGANSQVLINLRNNRKLLAHVKAFDRHMNMLLENVKELWEEKPKSGKGKKAAQPVYKERFVSKMFLRGDSIILVLRNPR